MIDINIDTPSPWLLDNLNFLQKTRSCLEKKKLALLDLSFSQPFEIKAPSQTKAVVLLHGFLGTPYFMKDLAKIYAERGFYCYAPVLPGHGSHPSALKNITLENLIHFLKIILAQIQEKYTEVHLCGFSFGALLALLISKISPISSLTLLAPPLGITPLSKLIPPICQLGFPQLPYPSAASLNGLPNPAMYAWHPISAVLPILKGIQIFQTHPNAWQHVPIFLLASYSDAVVKFQPLLNLFTLNHSHPNSQLRAYVPEAFKKPNDLPNSQTQIILETQFGPHIKNFSHIGLPTAPSDALLGINSSQYQNLPTDYLLGEKLPLGLNHKNLFRLFFNPDFEGLSNHLKNFLISL